VITAALYLASTGWDGHMDDGGGSVEEYEERRRALVDSGGETKP